MEQNPNFERDQYGEYKGQSPTEGSYGSDEMPQSAYPHAGPTPPPQDPYGSTGYQQSGYGQQQSQYGQQPGYGQQQSQQSGYQSPFNRAGDADSMERTSLGLNARLEALLSYIGLWITGIIFILIERDNRFVRFHAMQSILFFGGLSIIEWIASNVSLLNSLSWGLGIVQLVCWIFLMVQAWQGKYYKLPVVGDYAERFADQLKV